MVVPWRQPLVESGLQRLDVLGLPRPFARLYSVTGEPGSLVGPWAMPAERLGDRLGRTHNGLRSGPDNEPSTETPRYSIR